MLIKASIISNFAVVGRIFPCDQLPICKSDNHFLLKSSEVEWKFYELLSYCITQGFVCPYVVYPVDLQRMYVKMDNRQRSHIV